MHERCGNMQQEREIVTPSVSWLRNARRAVPLTEPPKREPSGPVACGENEDIRGLLDNYGVGVAEVARQVGISTSGVSKILTRTLSN